MTTNIDRAAEVVDNVLAEDPALYSELYGDENVYIAHHLADEGLITPDLPEFDDQDLVGVDDYGHIFVRHEVDDQWLTLDEARDLAHALLSAHALLAAHEQKEETDE